jgi:hypothetical protein
VPEHSNPYPLGLLAGYQLVPTGSDRGVMAFCQRHREGRRVHVLAVDSLYVSPHLDDLAYMCAEHEAEHHGGPPVGQAADGI